MRSGDRVVSVWARLGLASLCNRLGPGPFDGRLPSRTIALVVGFFLTYLVLKVLQSSHVYSQSIKMIE